MTIVKRPVPITATVYFMGMLALCFATGSVRKIGFGLCFAAVHEAGHLLAMRLCRARPGKICLTAGGMRIERPPALRLSWGQEVGIALAGPAVSLCLAGGFAGLAQLSAMPLLQEFCYLNLGFGLFNLLPVRQLDGGQTLYFLLCRRGEEPTARRAVQITSLLCLFLLTAGAALLCLRQGFSLPLVAAVVYVALCCN